MAASGFSPLAYTYKKLIDSAGRVHEFVQQQDEADCVLACCAMIVKRVTGASPSAMAVRQSSSGLGSTEMKTGAYTATVQDRLKGFGAIALPLAEEAAREARSRSQGSHGPPPVPPRDIQPGTKTTNLQAMLKDQHILSSVEDDSDNFTAVLRKLTPEMPGAICIRWTNGSQHFAVCDGGLANNPEKVVIVDPAYELAYLDIKSITSYSPANGVTGVVIEVMKVSGQARMQSGVPKGGVKLPGMT